MQVTNGDVAAPSGALLLCATSFELVETSAQPPRGSVDGEHFGLVQQPVEDRRGERFVAEERRPFGDALVRGTDSSSRLGASAPRCTTTACAKNSSLRTRRSRTAWPGRFFRSLKEECVWQHSFAGHVEARTAVAEWIRW